MQKSGRMPLLEALSRQGRMKTTPFHMPGHKKGKGIQPRFARMMLRAPFALDLTEIPGLDDLHNPQGAIREAQLRAARLFGADRTYFLVNGTTVGIHAAIASVCKPGEEILLPRDVHRSVTGACILAGIRPRYLPVRLDNDFFIPCPPRADDIKAALQTSPAVKAVFQVHPSYCGLTGDLAGTTKIAHDLNMPVIVDEAHGAHFMFNDSLPAAALESGADISIQSTHKTLGALTQASMLHIKTGLIDCRDVSRQLGILQTTSPSYLLMASLDAAAGHMESSGRDLMERTVRIALKAREEIQCIPGLRCMGNEICGKNGVTAIDCTKLLISVKALGISGHHAAERLLEKYRIQVEFSDKFNILCMLSIGNTAHDADRLVAALTEMAAERRGFGCSIEKDGTNSPCLKTLPLPQVVQTPRDAWFAPKRIIPLEQAVDTIAAEIIAPYPPGVPLVCPGEKITSEIIETVRELKAWPCSFHGPADPELNAVTVVDS